MSNYLKFALLLAASYIGTSFTMWELDPTEWDEFARGVTVGIPAYLAVVWKEFR